MEFKESGSYLRLTPIIKSASVTASEVSRHNVHNRSCGALFLKADREPRFLVGSLGDLATQEPHISTKVAPDPGD